VRTTIEIKKEMEFNHGLLGLIEGIKTVAIAQFHALTQRKERFARFLASLESFFEILNIDRMPQPLIGSGFGRNGIIMLTSDMGFMGGLNLKVIEKSLDEAKEAGGEPPELIVIGERGAKHLKDLGKTFAFFPAVTTEDQYGQAARLKDYLMSGIKSGKLGKLVVVYPQPISFTIQRVAAEELSCTELFFQKKKPQVQEKKKARIILESSIPNIIEYLTAAWLTYKLYEMFEDAKISEFAARTVHLENSYQELLGKNKKLKLDYFKNQHQLMDKNLRLSCTAKKLKNV